MKKISFFFLYIKEASEFRKRQIAALTYFYKCAEPYLISGSYYLDFKRKIIYKKGFKKQYLELRKRTFLNILVNAKKQTNLLKRIINTIRDRNFKLKIKSNKDGFSGTLAILGSINNDFKIFNYKNKMVLSIFESKDRADDIIKKRNTLLSIGFSIPSFKIYNNKESIGVLEPIISSVPYQHHLIFPDIIDFYTLNHKDKKPKKFFDVRDYICALSECAVKLNILKSGENTVFLNELSINPYCLQCCHGDFHYYNFLYDGAKHYFIDYELVDYHIFFYDIFFYVFFELFRFRDDLVWNKLLAGCYDLQLAKLFEVNDFKYIKKEIPLYLLLTIIVFYKNKIPKDVTSFLKRLFN